ncbi:MAG TPA: hypothetical protein VIL01_03045 [Thermomicrobiales bacterium]
MSEENGQPPTRGTEEIARLLSEAQAFIRTLPSVERRIALMAAQGRPAWEIANEMQMSEAAVWRVLDGVLALVTGRNLAPVETGGLGADTDPGVTGGYGDTGFGALDTEPLPDNTEPKEG